ncbi:MAG TPA: hypothetical protein VFN99_04510 [Gaiella sp.]|nr:hypothetical protein [Gaiella sp.]
MTIRTPIRLAGTFVGAAVLAASLGSAAEARIPEERWGDAPTVRSEAVVVPDAFERAVARSKPKRFVAAQSPETPDAFKRAAGGRMLD